MIWNTRRANAPDFWRHETRNLPKEPKRKIPCRMTRAESSRAHYQRSKHELKDNSYQSHDFVGNRNFYRAHTRLSALYASAYCCSCCRPCDRAFDLHASVSLFDSRNKSHPLPSQPVVYIWIKYVKYRHINIAFPPLMSVGILAGSGHYWTTELSA